MPFPLTRAAAIIFRGPSVLMIERFKDGERYFVLPGGGVEAGESAEAAVIREVAEETSVAAELVGEVARFASPERQTHRIFLCRCDPAAEPRFAASSVEMQVASNQNTFEAKWVPLADIFGLTIYPAGTREAIQTAASV